MLRCLSPPQEVGGYQARPLLYSYWLAANLPLHDEARQALLEARTAAARLRLALTWMRRVGALCCMECGAAVSTR